MTLERTMESMRANNEEYHDLIDDLTERKFYGEVVLYFQGGNIESNRKIERNTKTEIREKMLSRKHRRVIVPRPAGGVNG
jgi:hypothetical protein